MDLHLDLDPGLKMTKDDFVIIGFRSGSFRSGSKFRKGLNYVFRVAATATEAATYTATEAASAATTAVV